MTKITKKYVEAINNEVKNEVQMMHVKLTDRFKLFPKTVETDRVIAHLMDELLNNLNERLTKFVTEKGIPRKQRVVSDDKNIEFVNYCKLNRKKIQLDNPSYNAMQITKCLGLLWKDIPLEERNRYT